MILSGAMPLGNNLLQSAAAGKEVMAINMVAREEGMDPNLLLRKVASGRVVIMIAR
jgi:thiamine biosynthesis protein ThiC